MRFDGKTGGIAAPLTSAEEIDILHLLDTSSSMGSYYYGYGSNKRRHECKYSNAVDGFESEVQKLKEDKNAKYTFSLLVFDYPSNIKWKVEQASEISAKEIQALKDYTTGGATALNDAIVKGVEKAIELVKKGRKVILSILTDGGENLSAKYPIGSEYKVAAKIEEAKKLGVTVTFIGTDADVNNAVRVYNIDKTNTLVYDGSAKGMENAVVTRSNATSMYSKRMAGGASADSLTLNFFA